MKKRIRGLFPPVWVFPMSRCRAGGLLLINGLLCVLGINGQMTCKGVVGYATKWEGVNHCSLHCRLAKFRGLMYEGKYGAVIGRETRFSVCVAPSNNFQAMDFCSQSQRRISPCTESIYGISPNDSVIYSG